MKSLLLSLTLAAAAVLLAGCDKGSGAVADDRVLTRDSSGIKIAEISATSVLGAPRLTLTEDLRIGAEGDTTRAFTNLFDLDVAADGRIFALDISTRNVRVFGADGAFIRSFGRQGGGPGEFPNEPLGMTVSADTVTVHDRFRFHIFDASGRHLHTADQRITGNAPMPLFVRRGSQLLIGRNQTAKPVDNSNLVVRDTFRVFPVDPLNGVAEGPLVQSPGALQWFEEVDGRSVSQWLGPVPAAAIRENGEIYLARGDRYEVSVLSPTGSLVRIVRALVSPPEYSDAEYGAAMAREAAYYDSVKMSTYGELLAQGRRILERVRTRPVTGRLFVSPSGRILIERRDLDSDPSPRATRDTTTWDLLHADGRITGRIAVPPNVRLYVLRDTHLYAVARDSLDVQSIVRYRVPER